MSASSSRSLFSSARLASPGLRRWVEGAAVVDARGLYPRQDAADAPSSTLTLAAPTHSAGPRRNVSFIVIPAVLIPILVLAIAVVAYLVMRRRRIERHRREVKALTTRPFSRLMSFGIHAASASAVALTRPPPPPSVMDIRRSLYASTIHTVPLGTESIAPSSPTSQRTSFMEPPTPSRRSEVVSTIAPTTARASVDSRFWPSPMGDVPPVPDLPKHLQQVKSPAKGVESEMPESPHSLAGTTLRGSVDSHLWSAFSKLPPPPVPELPPLPEKDPSWLLAVPSAAKPSVVPRLPELPIHPSLQGLPRLVVDAKPTTAKRKPVATTSASSSSQPIAREAGPTALTPAPPPSSAPPPRRKRKTLMMERRERRLKLAIADAQFSTSGSEREHEPLAVARPSPAQLSPPLPSPPLPSPPLLRTPASATSGPPVPAPTRRPLGPRTFSQSSSTSHSPFPRASAT